MSDTLEARVKELEKRLVVLEDIEAIQKLERAYAFYLEHLLVDEIADCFAEDSVLEWVGLGRYIGQPAIRKLWHAVKEGFAERGYMIHPGPRYHGVITVSPDRKTAAGRWYVSGAKHGMEYLCENRYVNEDEVWKFSLLSVGGFPMNMMGSGSVSVDEAEEEKTFQEHMNEYPFSERLPRTPRQEHQNYLHPFSFKHPVTGKDINRKVEVWNKAHPVPMPPGGEKWMVKTKPSKVKHSHTAKKI